VVGVADPLLPGGPDFDQLQGLAAFRAAEAVQRQALVIEEILVVPRVVVGGVLPGHGGTSSG
jgi:hypothetical protein